MGFALLTVAPCFLYAYLLRGHHAVHDYTTLKFALAVATLPLVLLPAALLNRLLGRMDFRPNFNVLWVQGPMVAFCALATGLALFIGHPTHKRHFPDPDPKMHREGRLLDNNTKYEDMVFSDNHVIEILPPQALSLSMKLVHPSPDLHALWWKLKKLEGRAVQPLFYRRHGPHPKDSALRGILRNSEVVAQNDVGILYRLDRDAIFARAQDLEFTRPPADQED
jgi:hypothetical protein